ncbi:MAG TPA: BatD family protein [Planctomycetota bacterium]|nr:BatD family protein [Planctomycetota bacterium]
MIAPLILLLLSPHQGEVTVSSEVEPTVLKLGDDALLRIRVSGAEDVELGPLPEVKGLALRRTAPPSRSERIQIYGGVRSRSVSLVYAIRATPEAEGEYDIPPIRVTAGGRTFETKPRHLTVVRDFRGASLAFLDVVGPKRPVWRGEVFRIEATFGIREDIVQAGTASDPALRAAWADELRDAVRLEASQPSPDVAQRIDLNGRAGLVSRIGAVRRGNAGFVAWRLAASFVASFEGRILVGKSFFAFKHILRPGFGLFDEGEREPMFADAPGFEVEVKDLPEEGKPEGFGGAVGNFRVEASASPRDVKVGESLRLVFTIVGEGNLEFLEPPDLERAGGFERFRFFGRLEEKGEGKRQVVYDLAPLGEDATAIPSILFPFFDPEAGTYRTAKTDSIPLRVRPLPPGERLAELPGTPGPAVAKDDLRDAKPVFSVRPAPGGFRPSQGLAAAVPPSLWLGALLLRERRRRRERDPVGWRRRRAASAFRSRASLLRAKFGGAGVPGACAELAAAVAAYLADRDGRSAPEAWIGVDVAGLLRERGEPEEIARGFDALLAACDRATFAGAVDRGEARALLERAVELVARLERGGGRR